MEEPVEQQGVVEGDQQEEEEETSYVYPIASFPGYECIDSFSTIMIGLERSDDVPVITERSEVYLENDDNYLGNDKRLIIRLKETGEHIGGLSKGDSNALFPLISSNDVLVDMHLLSGVVKYYVKVQLDLFCRVDSPNYDDTLVSILRTVCRLKIEAELRMNNKKNKTEVEMSMSNKRKQTETLNDQPCDNLKRYKLV